MHTRNNNHSKDHFGGGSYPFLLSLPFLDSHAETLRALARLPLCFYQCYLLCSNCYETLGVSIRLQLTTLGLHGFCREEFSDTCC